MSDPRDAEIATLRGLLAEARPCVGFMALLAAFSDEPDKAAEYQRLARRIDAALSHAKESE